MNGQTSRIVIVGAGPAGIAAATKLFENGFSNIIILEAEDRIGGRVYTTKFGDYVVDLGGQWVHGEKGNVAFKLASPYGLLEKQDNEKIKIEQEFYDSSGNLINNEIENRFMSFVKEHFISKDHDTDTYESIGEYAEKIFNEVFHNDREVFTDRRKYLHYIELLMTSWDQAENWYEISAPETIEFHECDGDQDINWKTRGYSTVLDILMKRFPDPKKELPVTKNTILNSEVLSIDHSQKNGGAPIVVKTVTGKSYEADHVILTVSLGVLKEKFNSLFIPPLPRSKTEIIEGLGFGSAGKIYLLFDSPFWDHCDGRTTCYAFLWNEAERKIVENDVEKSWILGLTGARTVEHKPNLLEFWIPGKYGKAMESLPDDKVLKQIVEVLHLFLGKKFKVKKPISMLRTQWCSNPHFRGTCSYRTVETHKKKIDLENMNSSSDQSLKILFAGEAMSKHRYSTVDGAIQSGWEVAEIITNFHKQSK